MSDTAPTANSVQDTAAARRPGKGFRRMRRLFLGLVALGALSILVFVLLTANDLPALREVANPQTALSTQIMAADGTVLDNFYVQENRVDVPLSEISPYVIDALIATEDARFYQHAGIDHWSVVAIAKRYLTGTTSGGSTITMQLARNLFDAVGTDRTVTRKIKEIIVAAVLEKNFTKQEIIAAYLNTVNIFGNTYGIEMAAQRLFDKPARTLQVEEAAVLIAMLKGQGVFDPIHKPDTVRSRRNLVLSQMVKYGFLKAETDRLDSLYALPLAVAPQGPDHLKGPAPYFRQEVRAFLKEWCRSHTKSNGKPYDLYADGLKVYTTLDLRLQRKAEAAVREHLSSLQETFDAHIKGREPYQREPAILTDLKRTSPRYLNARKAGKSESEIDQEFSQARKMRLFSWQGDIDTVLSPMDSLRYYARFLETGVASIDPRTGAIKAWVGGIDFTNFKYDHVNLSKRQVGSTFKPFVYGAAMESGFLPCDQQLNQPVVFENVDGEGTRWAPKNSDGKIGGLMTLRSALATSTNMITARVMKQIGPANVADYAHRVGIKSDLEKVPSLCLGTTDLSVLELTSAYSTFANKGQYIEPFFITRIEDRKGNILAEFSPTPRQVISQENAYLMLEMLQGVVNEPGGTAGRLRFRYHLTNEIGAKTGTTQNHSDGWFVGVTPELVSGVWVGCADRRMRFRSLEYGQGASMALPIWAKYMKSLYEDPDIALGQEPFEAPPRFNVNLNCEGVRSRDLRGGMPTSREKTEEKDIDSFQ